MRCFSKKGGHGKEGQSFAPLFVSCSSMWNSSDQLEHAPSLKTGVESALKHHSDIKKSESEFQDQDSTSTLSTGQSNHVEAAMGKSKTVLQNFTAHPGWGGIYDVQAESGTKASLSGESATNTLPQPQVHHDHPTACLSYPWADTYFGRLVATYGSNAIIYPQMVGVTSTRVALPLECTESLPIYVNAKQYSAILKRRQVREYTLGCTKRSNKKGETGSWGTSTQSGSDVTSIFNGDDMFQQPEFRVSGFPFHMGATMQEAEDFMHVGT
ncbi:unnamed protein product [Withania somnifera]